jgi:hypothetical protein
MRQEHKKGGRGTRLLLNAAVFKGMGATLHKSDDRAVQISAFTSVFPQVLQRGPAQTAAAVAAVAAGSSEGEAQSPGRGATHQLPAAPSQPHFFAFLLRFTKPTEAKAFVDTISKCAELVAASASVSPGATAAAPAQKAPGTPLSVTVAGKKGGADMMISPRNGEREEHTHSGGSNDSHSSKQEVQAPAADTAVGAPAETAEASLAPTAKGEEHREGEAEAKKV